MGQPPRQPRPGRPARCHPADLRPLRLLAAGVPRGRATTPERWPRSAGWPRSGPPAMATRSPTRPENRPINAVDGDPATAWTCCAHSPAAGQTIQINLDQPVTTDHVTLLQAQLQRPNRRITAVTLRFDGSDPQPVKLTAASYRSPGSDGELSGEDLSPTRSHHRRRHRRRRQALRRPGPGGLRRDRDTGRGSGRRSAAAADRSAAAGRPGVARPSPVHPHDPQPGHRAAPPRPRADDGPDLHPAHGPHLRHQRDRRDQRRRLGLPHQPAGRADPCRADAAAPRGRRPVQRSSWPPTRPPDSTRTARPAPTRPSTATPTTAWIAETGPQAGEWLSFTPQTSRSPSTTSTSRSSTTAVTRSLPGSPSAPRTGSRVVDLPRGRRSATGGRRGRPRPCPISFPALTGSHVKVTIDAVQQVRALDYYATFTGATDILPVGIAELGLPVVAAAAPGPAAGRPARPGCSASTGNPSTWRSPAPPLPPWRASRLPCGAAATPPTAST